MPKYGEFTNLILNSTDVRVSTVYDRWHSRTLLEKVLIVLISCCFIVIFALSITVGVSHKNGKTVYIHDAEKTFECNDTSLYTTSTPSLTTIPTPTATTVPDNKTDCNCMNTTVVERNRTDASNHTIDISYCEKLINDSHIHPIAEANATSGAREEVCVTKECVNGASDLLLSMDMGVRPCDDFYSYACRAWINDTTIIEQIKDRFSALTDRMNLKIKDLLELPPANGTLPEHFQKARLFYETCKNWTERQEEGMAPFLKDVDYFGGYPAIWGKNWNDSNFDYITMMERMVENGFDNGILISVGIGLDAKNTSQEIIQVHQTSPGLNQLSLFRSEEIVSLYLNYTALYAAELCLEMKSPLPNCSVNSISIYRDLQKAVELEVNITKMLSSVDFLAANENTYNKMTIANLSSKAKEIEWVRLIQAYLPNITVDNDTEIIVTSPGFMTNFSRLIGKEMETKEGKRKVANYMVYRQVKEVARHLSRDLRHRFYDFQEDVDEHIKAPALWDECIAFTSVLFDLSLGAQYIKKYLPGNKRRDAIKELVEELKSEMKIIINQTSWMDDITKEAAFKKLQAVFLMAIHPDGLLNDTTLNSWYSNFPVGPSHYGNYKSGNNYLFSNELRSFGEPVDRSNWKYLPSGILESNAFYSSENNSIWVPLGIVQDWFFEENGPMFVNYGRMGFVLGHELSHAFDNQGSKLDEKGNWKNWWQNKTLVMFQNQSKCMEKIFDNYYVPEANLTINGSRTITENIADDVGISEVYRVFRKALERNPEQKLPGLNLTVEQLFWVNYASIWCEKDTPKYYENLIETDVHSPSKFRVNSPLANNRGFIKDFNCKQGDRMFTETHCHVWGDES